MGTLNVKLVSEGRPIPYGPAVPGIHVSFGQGSFDEAAFRHYCDEAGAVSIELMPNGPYRIHATARGYTTSVLDVVMPIEGQFEIELQREPMELPELTVNGTRFNRFLKGATAFMLYRNYLEGRDVTEFLRMLQDLGFNAVRVFGMAYNTPVNAGGRPFKPQDFGNVYNDSIPAFYRMLESFGMYGLWTNFPDNGFIMPDINQQLSHHERVTAQLRTVPNRLYELTNEINAHDFNRVDAGKFQKPGGIVSCVSAYGDEFKGDLPPGPHWDFGGLNPPRVYWKHIKDCVVTDHPFFTKLHRPVLLTEPARYGTDGSAGFDIANARMSAGSAAQSAPGIFFHTAQGRSQSAGTFDDNTMAHARAFIEALKAA